MSEEKNERWLTLDAAATRIGMCRETLSRAAKRGELPTTLTHRPRRSPPAWMVREQDIDHWKKNRGRSAPPDLPPRLHDLPVTVSVARRLVRMSKQHLIDELQEGKLRGVRLTLDAHTSQWLVRLGHLAEWCARPRAGKPAPRQFDPALLKQLEALVNGGEGEEGRARCAVRSAGEGIAEESGSLPADAPRTAHRARPSDESGPAR